VSSSLCDEVPHIFIPKSHLELREFLISSAKRLLQQYLPEADIPRHTHLAIWLNRAPGKYKRDLARPNAAPKTATYRSLRSLQWQR
jgi:hypothetical protein